ncbi:MAG: flippase-like domain-containing protein [Magnetococcales bacterium]|nr:flippase-like domain-containing protein [Magnetococcales bacterium]
MKRWLIPLKLAVTAGVFGWLLRDFDWKAFFGSFHDVRWPLIALAGLTSLGGQGLAAAWRWTLLARALGLQAPYPRMQRHFLVGLFFSLFLPGVVGGDAVRAWMLNRELGGGVLVRAGYSVIADRSNGIFGMAFVAGGVGWLMPQQIPQPWAMGMALLFAGLTVGWFTAPYLLSGLHRLGNRWIDRFIPPALLVFWRPEGRWWTGVGISILYVFIHAGVLWLVDGAIGLGIPPLFYLFMIPAVALVSSLPISIGGHGVREGLVVLTLGWWGVSVETSLAFAALMLLAFVTPSALGGLLFFLTRGNLDRKAMEEAMETDGATPAPAE